MSAAHPLRVGSEPPEDSLDAGEVAELRHLQPETSGTRDGSCPTHRRPENLTVAVRETGTTIQLVGSGEWDLAQQHAIQDAMRTVLDRCPECVVLDLSQLSFIDSTGMRNVLELHTACARDNIHLVIIPGGRAIQRTFEVSGLIDRLPFLRSEH
jgi:stage II sporulation protein AA (anti-sigma F factor antagonist)